MPPTRRAPLPPRNPVRTAIWICVLLALATLAVYSPAAHFDFVNYDDPDYSSGNPHVRAGLTLHNLAWAFTSSYAANWIPLTWISHMLDRKFFGSKAGGPHMVNVVLHILSTLLLFAALARMTKAPWASAFVAFVFALHPLHVESVAWIAERKDVLSALFFFLTIWLYLDYLARPVPWRYAAMAGAFACALLSKPMAVTLPFVLLLFDFWPLRRWAPSTRATPSTPSPPSSRGPAAGMPIGMGPLVIEKIPLIAMAIAASIVTFLAQRSGGAVVSDTLPVGLRIENALVSYAVYFLKFVWPSNLAVFYPYARIPAWQAILAGLLVIGVTWLAVRNRRDRPYLAVGWFWYLVTLLPAIGLIQVGVQSRADRYTYIPLIGLAIMPAWALRGYVFKRRWMRPHLALSTLLLCAIWATVTRHDLNYWRDSIALFEHTIAAVPDSYVAYGNLGAALREKGRISDAIAYFERAIEIKPGYAEAEDGLGEAYIALNLVADAIPHLAEAVRLEPNSASVHINLGAALSKRGDSRAAAEQYRVALELDPESAEAHCGAGVVLADQGHPQEALAQFYESVRLNRDYADGHYNLGRSLALMGRIDEAIAEFNEAIRLQPASAEAHYNLGLALATRNYMRDAVVEFQKAVDVQPDYVNARFNYASALANLDRLDEAIVQFQALLRLAPDFKPAQDSLAQAIALRDAAGKPKSR